MKTRANNPSFILRIIVIVLFVAAAVVIQLRFNVTSFFSRENITGLLQQASPFAPFFYMGVMALSIVISPLPSLPLDIAAGLFFGPYWGTLYSVIGATAGAVISFLIARLLGRDLIVRFMGGHIIFCHDCTNRILTKIVFLSRLIPFVSFDLISYGAGLTHLSVWKFALATSVGMIPLTFVYNYFGSVLVAGSWVTITFGVLFVILFFLLPRLIEKHNLFSLKKYFRHEEKSASS